MKRRVIQLVLPLLAGLIVASCSSRQRDFEADMRRLGWDWTEVDESTAAWAIEIADKRAQLVLDEYNQSPEASIDGGPFRLDQYARNIIFRTTYPTKESAISIHYELTVFINLFGHPQHFWIEVNEQDSSTRVSYGW